MLKLINNNGEFIPILYSLLYQNDKYSLLPELIDICGEEVATTLIDRFAGMTLTFPSYNELKLIARDVAIYFRLVRIPSGLAAPIVDDMASEYGVDTDVIRNSYERTKKTLRLLGINLYRH